MGNTLVRPTDMIERNKRLSSLPLFLKKHAVGPVFHLSQYLTSEGRLQVVRLSATILTSSPISFNGSIEVDIAAENISAELGKCTIIHLHFVSSHFLHFYNVFGLPFTSSLLFTKMSFRLLLIGSDYIVNLQDPPSRIFTVAFQSRQANSTENSINITNDIIFEGRETFRLRIVEARFLGQAATVFRAQDRLNETTADVIIEDNDCKHKMSA